MKVSKVLIIFILLINASCEVIAPNTSTGGDSNLQLIRFVNIKCESSSIINCNKEEFGKDEALVYGVYTKDPCKEVDHNPNEISAASATLHCSTEHCKALLKDFSKLIESGKYTFYAYIDVNHNESLDADEPFFCSDEVSIIAEKKLVNLEVNFTRTFEE